MDTPIKELAPHEQRVVAEHKELADRLDKLSTFVRSETMETVPPRLAALMLAQGELMSRLELVMRMRISAFDEPDLTVDQIPDDEKNAVFELLDNANAQVMLNDVMDWVRSVKNDVKHLSTLPAGSELGYQAEGAEAPTTITMQGDSHVAFQVAVAAVQSLLDKCPVVADSIAPDAISIQETPEVQVASNESPQSEG